MSKPVAVNTSSLVPSGSLQKGKISYTVQEQPGANYAGGYSNKSWYSAVPTDGDRYVIVSSSNDIPRFWITPSTSSADVLLIVNGLPDRYNKPAFTTIGAAFDYLLGSDQYFVYGGGFENLDVEGVTAYFDAAQIGSYPTTGSTWYSISSPYFTASINGAEFQGNTFNFPNGGKSFIKATRNQGDGFAVSVVFTSKNKSNLSFLGTDLSLARATASPNTSSISSSVSVSNTRFSNVAAVFETNPTSSLLTRKVYINGELKINSTISGSYQPAGFPVNICVNNNNNSGTSSLQGLVVYDRAINQDEVNQMYYGGNIVTSSLTASYDAGNVVSFYSGSSITYDLLNKKSGSLQNGVIFQPTNGGYWTFDGVDDRILLEGSTSNAIILPGSGPFTINAWVKTTTAVNSLGQGSIFSNSSGGPVASSFCVKGGKIGYYYYPVGGPWASINGNKTINDNKWHLLTWVQNSNGYMDLYVDGVIDVANQFSAVSNNPLDVVGASWAAYFNGNIALLTINRIAFNSTEVGQNFNAQRNRFNI
jgi:hypothetical protein